MTAPCGCSGLRPRLASWGGFGALALWAAVAAWAAAGEAPPEGIRSLRDAGWACLDRGDTEGALDAAARMLQLQPGCRDALLLEDRAHQARLAPAPTADPSARRLATSIVDDVRREMPPRAKATPDRLETLIPAGRIEPLRLGQPVTIDLVETPLAEAVRRLSAAAGFPIRLAPDAAQASARITLHSANMPLAVALGWVGRLSGLHYVLRDGAAVFTGRPGDTGDVTCQTYDLHNLVAPPRKRAAADLDALGNGWARYIRATVAPGSWAEQDPESVLQERNSNSIAYRGGRLVVVHSPDVQKQVADLIEMFRHERNLQVHLQARFIFLTNASLDELHIDFAYDNLRGTNGRVLGTVTNQDQVPNLSRFAGFDTTDGSGTPAGLNLTLAHMGDTSLQAFITAVRKKQQGVTLSAPRITCLNTERANLQVLVNHNYIQSVSGDNVPTIGNIPEGMIFDVQPFVSADRRYITVTLQPQQRELVSLVDFHFLTNTNVTQTVGTNTGIATLAPFEVHIQIPTTRLRSTATTVTIPNGGTALVAGFAQIEENSGVATVPFLETIPVLSQVFRSHDRNEGRSNMLILLSAETSPDIFAE